MNGALLTHENSNAFIRLKTCNISTLHTHCSCGKHGGGVLKTLVSSLTKTYQLYLGLG